MKKFKLYVIRFLVIGFLLLSVGTSIIAGVVYAYYRQLPYVSLDTYQQSINSKIYDEKGRLILELFKNENRTKRVGLSEISPNIINAVISIEDKRFYEHYGIDLKRIVKSLIVDIRLGRLEQGASTITQQLARNIFLSLDKKFSRKIKEIMLALKIEHRFTKDEIMTMFLNEIPFGQGTYGIESASNVYFRKHAKDLDIHEAALLAAVIRGTTAYDPFRNFDKAIQRRNVVLKEMYKDGYITKAEYEKNRKAKPKLIGRDREICAAPYYIYSNLLPKLKEKYGENMVNSGGLKIYTNLNLDIQNIAEEEFAKAEIFEDDPELNGAVIVLEIKTGKILAVVGGREFSNSDQFNRAFDALRQPGSLMKPIVYLTAFDNGISPNKMFSDVPREYFDPWTQTIWQPQNYEGRYHGPVILRSALENSYNIVAIELLKEIGAKNVIEYARKLGITSQLRETLSLALGAYEVSPIDMAKVYSVFANSGQKVNFSDIRRIEDINGIEVEKYDYNTEKLVAPSSVAIINNILTGVVENGSGTRARIPGWTIAGKTGTTDDFTNAWFCGYTPNILVISYIGYDYPKTIGEHCSGGRIVAPVVKNIMKRIFDKFPERFAHEEFPVPDDVVEVEICRESGLLKTDECNYTVKQLFHKGDEPTMLCNFHSPDMNSLVTKDTEEMKLFFKEPDKKTIISPYSFEKNDNNASASLDRLKNELKFFGD